MNAIQTTIIRLPLDAITLDAELQPRAQIDQDVVAEYAEVLVSGGSLPPVLMVDDGNKLWLADGYHRFRAHEALGLAEIAAEVREGTALDAMMLSLGANAQHGKRREPGDYQRAYQIAVKYKLAPPADVEAVRQLLRCSERWARDLTADAREHERLLRDEAIQRARDEGKSLAAIARETGVPRSTVQDAVRNRQTSVSVHPDADPIRSPSRADAVRAELSEMESPRAQRWHKALAALRTINEQASPAAMFGDRYSKIDHAIGPELTKARDWINDLHRRFFDE